ncbi:hypothetical protein HK100_009618 [Physocladia obscura]|uniref:Disease resistance R13L4/SHOC-2-like LRR domain-containing protein n=1 Tax=Physocladia obscura TaxID=109957 RepID=A0AAD5SLS3_9FUNG|nr:hypothetical protein HK100_009618 [Physocladia obscura]
MFLNRNWNSHFKTEYAKQLSATKPQITAFINWDLIPSDSILWCEPFSRRSNEIPVQINLLKDIQFLDLGSCSLSGEIPDSLWSSDFKNLQHITLSNNTLTGVISPLIANFAATLEALDLGANNLSGCIPSVVGSLKHLSELYLKSNNLHGSLPHEIGLLEQLVYLDVSNNRLSGPLPHSLFHCSKLVHLKIACNDFCGEVSGRVGNLFELEVLSAFSNQFVGCIPSEIGRLELLSELYLNDNSLTGQIPKELCDLRFLEICDLTGNIDLTCDFESFEALQF